MENSYGTSGMGGGLLLLFAFAALVNPEKRALHR